MYDDKDIISGNSRDIPKFLTIFQGFLLKFICRIDIFNTHTNLPKKRYYFRELILNIAGINVK